MVNDWNFYRDFFPAKYWDKGVFDEYLLKELSKFNNVKVLDVGGGVFGTEVLQDFYKENNFKLFLCDPSINNLPKNYESFANLEDGEFDIIIARGSINYLKIEELLKIKGSLKMGGLFLANTFLEKPSDAWKTQEVKNIKGEVGLEKSRCVKNIVEHQLIFEKYHIEHSFFYYSEKDFISVFPGISFYKYKKNSCILKFKK